MILRFRRLWKIAAVLMLMAMAFFNALYIHDLVTHHKMLEAGFTDGAGLNADEGDHPTVGRHIVEEIKKEKQAKKLKIKVVSSKEEAKIFVNEKEVHTQVEDQKQRGIHVAVLNQATGSAMSVRVFDTYIGSIEDTMVTFLNSIMDGRIICFAIMDEGSFSLKENGRGILTALGSRLAGSLNWRDTWAFVTEKGGSAFDEDVGKSTSLDSWGRQVRISVTIPLTDSAVSCDWPDSEENRKRAHFCSLYEGYGVLCDCANPLPLKLPAPSLSPNNIANVPVSVMASNRGPYLFRMLRTLLSTAGGNRSMTVVFIDGFFQEPKAVAELLGVRAVQHEPKSSRNGRITQHYKMSLTTIFDMYPKAEYTIVVEEDLDVAPDFFSYFSQTVHLMKEDSSLYCISAWNDQGYQHTALDPGLLYRVDTMPGLGWVLSRTLYKEELEPQWPTPDKLWDWDMWMRTDFMRKGRECIIPDISRTFHFGVSGNTMNPYFHDRYFKNHVINRQTDVALKDINRMTKAKYEEVIEGLLKANVKIRFLDHFKRHEGFTKLFKNNIEAIPVDHTVPTDSDSFIPSTKGKVYAVYISRTNEKDWDTWIVLAGHWKIWDLDARGFHNSLWRLWLKNNHILVVGCPFSPYCKYKPERITPIKLEKPPR